jgi:hypothetical protein
MFRALLDFRSAVADYTVGTVIVLVQMALAGHRSRAYQ